MADPDLQIWEDVHAHLRSNHPAVCRQWFREIEPLGVHGNALCLRARSDVHRDYLRRTCLEPFNDSVRSVTGALLAVRFLGPNDASPDGRPPARRAPEPRPADETLPDGLDDLAPDSDESIPLGRRDSGVAAPTLEARPAVRTAPVFASTEALSPDHPDALVINPDFGFEHFVIGPNNRLAHAAAVAVSENPGRSYNPLFIHGDVGLGKTHLLQAVCLRIRERNPAATMHYLSCDGFITQFMAAVQGGRMNEFRHRFRDVDVLVIDDIHFLAKRDRTQEEFFHTFNALYQCNKQIILSSDAPPEEIPDLEDRLVSRFKWGLVTKVDPPTYETRVEILKSKASLRGMNLPDEVACHIAARIEGNIRELEGAITKIQIHALVAGGRADYPVSLDLAKEALGEAPDRITKGPSVDAIIHAVTEFYGVKRADVLGKRRHKSISLPRQVCMYLARQHTRHSLEEIGGYFGGRDHTTVMHAIKTVSGKLEADPDFKSLLSQFERQLLEPGRA